MAHIVQCRICKQKIDTEKQDDWIMPTKNWYYHKQCYEDFGKKKKEIKEGDIRIKISDEEWFSVVYDYLRRDLKISINFVKLKSQWASFLKKGMTAKGIYFNLRYFYEIQHGDTSKSEGGIGIVPLIYEEGAQYWCERNQRDHGICDRIEAQVMHLDETPVKIIPQTRQKKEQKKIDLSAIALMEDDE